MRGRASRRAACVRAAGRSPAVSSRQPAHEEHRSMRHSALHPPSRRRIGARVGHSLPGPRAARGRGGRHRADRGATRTSRRRRRSSTRPSAACGAGARATGRPPASRRCARRSRAITSASPASRQVRRMWWCSRARRAHCSPACSASPTPATRSPCSSPRYVTYDGVVDTPGRGAGRRSARGAPGLSLRPPTRSAARSRRERARCCSTHRTIRPESSSPARSSRRLPPSRSATTSGC